MSRSFLLVLGTLVVLASCKSTDERLADLSGSLDSEYHLKASVYDAGQLVHEAFVGLMTADTLSFEEMGRGLWYAAQVLEHTEVPLLRADALSFIAELTLRFPIPPTQVTLEGGKEQLQAAESSVNQLLLATEKLSIGARLIPQLGSADPTVVDEALATLRKVSGEDLGNSPEAWRKWWGQNENRITEEVATEVGEPLRHLGGLRYRSLGEARAVLGLLANTLALYDLPQLRDEIQRSFLQVARQVVVYAVIAGFRDRDPEVRAASARAAERILAPAFSHEIAAALMRERDPDAKVALIKAGRFYPSKLMARALIQALEDEEPTVTWHARKALTELLDGEEAPKTREGWALWWGQQGKARWP